jgi:putative membrane protein
VKLWCAALNKPWSWHWIAYPGVWLMAGLPTIWYLLSMRRHRDTDRRTLLAFLGGMFIFWISSDWPVGTLGAGYLASVHMVQYVLYTLAVAPLLLIGTPEWMARRTIDRYHLRGPYRWLSRHLLASGIVFNLVLLATHSPIGVDTLRSSQLGSFAMDMSWLVSGVILWLPIINPIKEDRVESFAAKMVYLFLAAGVVPIVPASFLTFAGYPLYSTYELAPRVGSLTALEDQQLAGIVMKLGMVPVIWGTLAVQFFRWAARERSAVS